jgi:cytochrome P450
MLDILCHPDVEARVRNEIASTDDPCQSGLTVDMPKLLANPLLQSIYNEELRLRNAVMIQRTTLADTVMIGDYRFPKGDMIIASSWHEARDRNIWNEGTESDFHPVEDFWADRFIVYPNNPSSGPSKAAALKKARPTNKSADDKPQFSAEPVAGSFIPYGGGQKICPGRFYAKQEAIGSVALFLKAYDIELDRGAGLPQPDMEFFPFGVVQPTKAFKARIRRRRA